MSTDRGAEATGAGESATADVRGRGTATGRCTGWDNGNCEGTAYCPPRCPRAVDASGDAYLVRESGAVARDRLVAMYEDIDGNCFGLPPERREAIEDWLDRLHANGWNLVAVAERVFGPIAVVPGDDPAPKFVVFVAEDARGRGIGTELVQQAVARAAARDHEALWLRVEHGNRRAVSVYLNVGFDVAERARMHIKMRLPLDGPVAARARRPPAERE